MSITNLVFDPKAKETISAVEKQVSDWGGGPGFYAVTDDCGPCIIAAEPWRSPALSIEGQHDAQAAFQAAQSALRPMADGLARSLDFDNRAQQLKCVGNGVVPAQAAAAAVILIRRSGFMTNKAVARINKAQAATECVAETEVV